jgi:RNA polymerase-binding transcription factor DksA
MQNFPDGLLDGIRKSLEEQKKQAAFRISELNLQDPFSDPERANDNAASDTEASEESNHERFTALTEQLQQKLTDIDNALFRISDGTYGLCSGCNLAIEAERLSVLPTATLCVGCEQQKSK